MSEPAHHYYLTFGTASGFCGIAWNDRGITRFQLPTRSPEAAERLLLRRAPGAEPNAPPPAVAEAIAAVRRYFEGEETDFSGLDLDLNDQDAFFGRIYAAARRVGWGRTTTYGTLAKELGAGPEAARDVGQAMARNPVPLIIPCHRVLAAGGKIGGFSAPGARRPRSACSSWKAFTSSPRERPGGSRVSDSPIVEQDSRLRGVRPVRMIDALHLGSSVPNPAAQGYQVRISIGRRAAYRV